MKILLVEDEPVLGAVIQRGLEKASYTVDWVQEGDTGLARATEGSYALVVLDLMLPGTDGWSICRELRARKNRVPILMLTARDTVEDRVRGLELGADDYLPKPFDARELLARVRALLRRDGVHKARIVRIADLTIDTHQRRVWRADTEVTLTQREYTLLEALAANEGRVLSREWIQEFVWTDPFSYSNTVEVHIAMLRKKIDADRPVKLIHTIHRQGYTLRNRLAEEGVS